MIETIRPNKNTIEEAVGQIMVIMQEVYMMGGNDSEIPELDRIMNSLKKGELSPESAIEMANKIHERKNDYH